VLSNKEVDKTISHLPLNMNCSLKCQVLS